MNSGREIITLLAGLKVFVENSYRGQGLQKGFMLSGKHKVSHPWDHYHLSKKERVGLLPDEIQALRYQKWLANNQRAV